MIDIGGFKDEIMVVGRRDSAFLVSPSICMHGGGAMCGTGVVAWGEMNMSTIEGG